ncbi:MAG: hypothetical protein A2521_03910 [Deltaproteobacteria bacterium RIFOXYD12_FULL_57_12]|nr:MAG: hypothetical protein A2521_03910 [Deltaproteobacteria bacterium RIFOXYD12_FULL_57_12]
MKDKKEKTIQQLSGRQVRFLRGLGHHLEVKVSIGRDGITRNLVAATQAILLSDELVKVKVGSGCELERAAAADLLAGKTAAALVQVLGKTFLLFRENPDRKDGQRIVLP